MFNNNNPSLSQYFGNDPPSFFDELANNQETPNKPQTVTNSASTAASAAANQGTATTTTTVNNISTATQKALNAAAITNPNFSGGFRPTEYVENAADLEDDIKVTDDVKNMWQPALVEHGQPPLLTTPGMQSANELSDAIALAAVSHLGEKERSQRKLLTVDQVTQDERGIRSLIASGCYRAAVNLCGRLLTIYGQGYGRAGQPAKHSPHSLQLWFTRLALLCKLGEYELLQAEAEPFDQLQRADVFFEFYPEMYKNRIGSIACFSFRLLLAELPMYFGNPQLALDRLSQVHTICTEIGSYYRAMQAENPVKFWKRRELRTLHSMINCALLIKKFSLIDTLMKDMVLASCDLSKEERRALFSAWGRIYLQIGDIFGAEQKFAEARRLREINSAPDLRDLVDKGLITVAQNDFPEAYAIFQKALHLESGNTMILNNMGVCLLYAGKLRDAINLFERAINLNPQKSLNESLLINLSTLYELESNNSKNKKLNLLHLINKFKPDLNISVEICLKLQAPN